MEKYKISQPVCGQKMQQKVSSHEMRIAATLESVDEGMAGRWSLALDCWGDWRLPMQQKK